MYQEQRLEKILELLNEKGQVSAKEVVEYLGVSRDTIRRDFRILGERQDVQRTHGGLILPKDRTNISSYKERLRELTPSKAQIALKAQKLLKEEGVYFVDASTITTKIVEELSKNTKVYSHSLDVAITVSENENVDFHLLGGEFFKKQRFYYGNDIEILKSISFDIVFTGAAGIKGGGITLDDYEDVVVKKLALENAKIKVLVAELSKFDKDANFILDKISNFDYFITDKKPSEEIMKLLGKDIQIIY